MNLDDLTSANIWVAALEKNLYYLSQKKLLFSDLNDHEHLLQIRTLNDDVKLAQILPQIYTEFDFKHEQVNFLLLTNEKKVECWRNANFRMKWKFWKILEFHKQIEDCNRIAENNLETLERYIDVIREIRKRNKHQFEFKQRIIDEANSISRLSISRKNSPLKKSRKNSPIKSNRQYD